MPQAAVSSELNYRAQGITWLGGPGFSHGTTPPPAWGSSFLPFQVSFLWVQCKFLWLIFSHQSRLRLARRQRRNGSSGPCLNKSLVR